MHEEVKSVVAGKYTLVARFHEGVNKGALWADGKVVDLVQGSTLDEAWTQVCARLYGHLSAQATQRGEVPPSAEEARRAFLNIGARLTAGHKAMLRAHLLAPQHQITARSLAQAAGYAGYSAANLQYGLLGAMLYAEMPEPLPLRADGTPVMTCMIGHGQDQRMAPEAEWIWTMRAHIVDGLRTSGIL